MRGKQYGENYKAHKEGRHLLPLHPGLQRLRPARPSGAGKPHLHPPPGMTGKKLEKELQRQADAFEQEVHSGISLDASISWMS